MLTGQSASRASEQLDEQRLEKLRTRYLSTPRAQRYHSTRYGDLEGRINLYMMRRALLRAFRSAPAKARILDIPCGTGQYSWFYASQGYKVTASDVSPQMLEVAAQPREAVAAGQQPTFQLADIFNLQFAPGTFDIAVTIRLFHLLNRPERIAALRQMAKVSELVVADYSHKCSLKHFSRVVRYQLGLRREPRQRFSKSDLIREVAEAGLEVRDLIWVAPGLSEIWLAVLKKKS
jgi:2-polyprenyl-3-methyl-5-hydroxy-6-metoxy-1,4-benzoquinol methylase